MTTERDTTILERQTRSPEATERVARALADHFRPGDVVLLTGELGAGKTRFVRGLAAGLFADPATVSSPTFVLVQEYPGDPLTLVHADAYRLTEQQDLDDLGVESLDGCVLAIEWPERIGFAPPGALRVAIEHAEDADAPVRTVRIVGDDAWRRRLARLHDELDEGKRCPTCGGPVGADAASAPFCSERCRMADLGRWMRGDYVISRELKDTDLDELE